MSCLLLNVTWKVRLVCPRKKKYMSKVIDHKGNVDGWMIMATQKNSENFTQGVKPLMRRLERSCSTRFWALFKRTFLCRIPERISGTILVVSSTIRLSFWIYTSGIPAVFSVLSQWNPGTIPSGFSLWSQRNLGTIPSGFSLWSQRNPGTIPLVFSVWSRQNPGTISSAFSVMIP